MNGSCLLRQILDMCPTVSYWQVLVWWAVPGITVSWYIILGISLSGPGQPDMSKHQDSAVSGGLSLTHREVSKVIWPWPPAICSWLPQSRTRSQCREGWPQWGPGWSEGHHQSPASCPTCWSPSSSSPASSATPHWEEVQGDREAVEYLVNHH